MFYKILQLLLKFPFLQYIRVLFFFFDSITLAFIGKPKKTDDKKRLLIVFPLALGDAVISLGILKQVYKVYSGRGYEVSLLCHAPYAKLFEDCSDNVLTANFHAASVSAKARISLFKKCREQYYDLVIDPTGCEDCTPGVFVVHASVGAEKIGALFIRRKKNQLPEGLRKRIFDKVVRIEEPDIHRMVFSSKVFSKILEMDIKPALAELNVGNMLDLPSEYMVVFPSASTPIKMWPTESFVEITERIYRQYPIPVVLFGTKVDAEVISKFQGMLNKDVQVIDLVGKTDVLSMIELIGRASLVLTNDTSVYHIAVATQRKTVCVSGAYNRETFINYSAIKQLPVENVCAVVPDWPCANCDNSCDKNHGETYPCVLVNSIDQVWDGVCKVLNLDKGNV